MDATGQKVKCTCDYQAKFCSAPGYIPPNKVGATTFPLLHQELTIRSDEYHLVNHVKETQQIYLERNIPPDTDPSRIVHCYTFEELKNPSTGGGFGEMRFNAENFVLLASKEFAQSEATATPK
jgi:hypothetical protein